MIGNPFSASIPGYVFRDPTLNRLRAFDSWEAARAAAQALANKLGSTVAIDSGGRCVGLIHPTQEPPA